MYIYIYRQRERESEEREPRTERVYVSKRENLAVSLGQREISISSDIV